MKLVKILELLMYLWCQNCLVSGTSFIEKGLVTYTKNHGFYCPLSTTDVKSLVNINQHLYLLHILKLNVLI